MSSADPVPASEALFVSKRLRARRLAPGDLADMLAVYGDADVVRWVGDGAVLDEAACRRWLDVTADNYDKRGYGMAALESREGGKVVGFCGLVHPGGQEQVEIKYALRRDCWGRGLATEAVTAMLAYGEQVLQLKRVIATTAPENEASHRVLLKVGMERGELRRDDDGDLIQVFAWKGGARA